MKRKSMAILSALLLAALLTGCAGSPAAQEPVLVTDEATGATVSAVPTVTVQGAGELKVEPDMATITFAVQAYDKPSAEEAASAVNTLIDTIKAALIAQGIKDEDMQTTGYSMYQSYRYDNSGNRTGKPRYNIDNNLTVNIYEIDKVGDIIDAATEAGATNVYGVQFGIKDRIGRETDALAIAFENAKVRAEALAALSGKQLGTVLVLTDGSQMSEVYYNNDMPRAEAAMMKDAGYAGASISPGTLTLTANVSVRFVME